MASKKTVQDLFAATAVDTDGEKLGVIKEVFLDAESGDATFIALGAGLFNHKSLLVPLRGAHLEDRSLHLAFPKHSIEEAPPLDVSAGVTEEQRTRIFEHYGLTTPPADDRVTGGSTTNGALG
ncbi:PRC-barrel domain-containing protein [Neoactinobaculum massilliense]|uniref:PRC-barrel domain-containing protein n=1 Tax=Neoactinobaculum massilliense TaxID=2364794 RepID=UPI0013DE0118|nr:PRC-barrel domain-containing protein [Neoactinobaculum massilliense]